MKLSLIVMLVALTVGFSQPFTSAQTRSFIVDEELTGGRIPPVVLLSHHPVAGTITGSYDGFRNILFHDNGLGWLVRDSDNEPIGLIVYNTGYALFNAEVTVDTVWFTYWADDGAAEVWVIYLPVIKI